jgi:hypothetical protein
MKAILYISMMTVVGLFFSSCASMRNDLVLETVGPAPGQSAEAGPGPGTLMVYSACKVNADFDSRNPNVPEYSDYRILDADGRLFKWVHNVADNILQGPIAVELPAGKYFVKVRSNGYGIVTIPVIIAANQGSVLHLDGNQAPDEYSLNSKNAVCLPDGEIVGWKNKSHF